MYLAKSTSLKQVFGSDIEGCCLSWDWESCGRELFWIMGQGPDMFIGIYVPVCSSVNILTWGGDVGTLTLIMLICYYFVLLFYSYAF